MGITDRRLNVLKSAPGETQKRQPRRSGVKRRQGFCCQGAGLASVLRWVLDGVRGLRGVDSPRTWLRNRPAACEMVQ
jgi:hypothetical protein